MEDLDKLKTDSKSFEEFHSAATERLAEFNKEMFEEFNDEPYMDKVMDSFLAGEDQVAMEWNFKSAIFLASTVVTAVGYGYITPRSQAGRIFCVVYGLFGIPLTIVTIADLGRFLGWGVLMGTQKLLGIYTQLKHKLGFSPNSTPDNTEAPAAPTVPLSVVLLLLMSYPLLGGIMFYSLCSHEFSYVDTVYYSLVTIFTIGYGDVFLAEGWFCYGLAIIYMCFGVILVTMCVDLVGGQWIYKIHYFGRKMKDVKRAMGKMQDVCKNFGIGLGTGLGTMQNSLAFRMAAVFLSQNGITASPKAYYPPEELINAMGFIDSERSSKSIDLNQNRLRWIDSESPYIHNRDFFRQISRVSATSTRNFGSPRSLGSSRGLGTPSRLGTPRSGTPRSTSTPVHQPFRKQGRIQEIKKQSSWTEKQSLMC